MDHLYGRNAVAEALRARRRRIARVVVARGAHGIDDPLALANNAGVAIVSLSALANFLWIPYYPLWAMTVLALDVAAIWALTNANLGDS